MLSETKVLSSITLRILEDACELNESAIFFNVDTTSELAFGCENMGLPVPEIEKRIAKMEQIKKIRLTDLKKMGLRPLYPEDLGRNRNNECIPNDLLRLSGFALSYNEKQVVKVDEQKLPSGNTIAVTGCNGAGKSSFARCLCGLEKRRKGVLESNGVAYKRKERLKHCYMVMQDVNHQLFTESVLDEVLLSMEEPDNEKAERILDKLDLLPLKDLHPMSLSGGQKQRVAIASAIACEKEILIFDEPTSGLDFRHMKEVCSHLRQLKDMGKTIFIITHDLELILESCTHVLHFDSGRVIENYSLDEMGEQKLLKFFTGEGQISFKERETLCV
jgi:energy-coupling factor transport system ATP-binding protein